MRGGWLSKANCAPRNTRDGCAKERAACWAGCSVNMLFHTIGQGSVFLWMAVFGAFGGALYLVLSGVRKAICAGTWLSLAADIAFGLGLAALFTLGLITSTYGEFRVYCLAGFVAGYAVFMLGAAWIISRAASRICLWIGKLVQRISKTRLTKVIFR